MHQGRPSLASRNLGTYGRCCTIHFFPFQEKSAEKLINLTVLRHLDPFPPPVQGTMQFDWGQFGVFLAWGFLAWGFLAWGFLTWGFLAWGFLAWGFLAWGFLAWGFLAWGFLAWGL